MASETADVIVDAVGEDGGATGRSKADAPEIDGEVHLRNAAGLDEHYQVNVNPRTPGVQGPTFVGKPRVPEGQTFTREPETGARHP